MNTYLLRKYAPAAFAALGLMSLPLVSQAKDDDDHDHKKKADHPAEKKGREEHHDPRIDAPRHKDDVVAHKKADAMEEHHKVEEHRKIEEHRKVDPVVEHRRRVDDVIVHKDEAPRRRVDDVVVHRKGDPVIRHERDVVVRHHRHPGYALRLADGWRGHGWYYGPPNVTYYESGPDVVYYTSREEGEAAYADDEPSTTTAVDESREAAVQRALRERGYYDGVVDGQLGPMSRRAIARYKGDHGLRPDGEVTDGLLRSLGID